MRCFIASGMSLHWPPNLQLLSLKWKLVAAISRSVLMAKLLYRLSFIDVESTSMVPMPRVQSCPNLVHRCDWPDWQRQIQAGLVSKEDQTWFHATVFWAWAV